MISILPNDVKSDVIKEVARLFNTSIEEDIIDFIQDYQSKMAVEEGFSKCDTVKFYNLAVFKYNKEKVDIKTTMVRLLKKYNGDVKAAEAELKELGKSYNINKKELKKFKREHKVVRIPNHAAVKSICGKFTAR